jgi:RNA polymerase sigma-70 factor (ECF subfamily)
MVANALLGRTPDADDAVQIALMRVLEGLASWRGEASLQSWARKVAANACLRLAEQNRRHARGVTDETDVDELVAPVSVASGTAALPGSVGEYLDRLPAVQRDVVVLRHALGYSVEEIATMTDAAVGTVKSRLLCGRRALRKLVRRDDALDELAGGFRRRAVR